MIRGQIFFLEYEHNFIAIPLRFESDYLLKEWNRVPTPSSLGPENENRVVDTHSRGQNAILAPRWC